MVKAFIVRHPMGMGKTRIVLKHVLRGASKNLTAWNRRLGKTLIFGPNDHVERAWLRELMLLAQARGVVARLADDSQIRAMSNVKLTAALRNAHVDLPQFFTFGRLGQGERRRCRFLIVDEWHRLPERIRKSCRAYVLRKKKKQPWFLGGKKVTGAVYFVSATPVNPVLEQEDKDMRPLDLREFQTRYKKAKSNAICVIQAIAGNRSILDGNLPFFKIVRSLGVQELKVSRKTRWKLPTASRAYARVYDVSGMEEDELRQIKLMIGSRETGDSFSLEYAYAVGLIRTKANRKGVHMMVSARKRSRSSFGFRYSVLHHPTSRTRMDARRWLLEKHTRLRRLINTLVGEGILVRQGQNLRLSGKAKALIFCAHRGVALGLTRALRLAIDQDAKSTVEGLPHIATNVDTALTKRFGAKEYTELLIEGFRKKSGRPQILVATDILSESLDLHEACRFLVHYQLPWSPLRLFQRIGRLTRLKAWGNRLIYNQKVRVGHVVIPGSVEEERVNRLIRRIKYLSDEEIWPEKYPHKRLLSGLIGRGPSLHYQEELDRAPVV